MANPNPSPSTRFKPGQCGNPAGRPKGQSLTALLRERLAAVDPRTGKTFGELVAEALVLAALRGSIEAIRVILDRTEGKVPDRVVFEDTAGPPWVIAGDEDPAGMGPDIVGRIGPVLLELPRPTATMAGA